jgi:hypothetical protein
MIVQGLAHRGSEARLSRVDRTETGHDLAAVAYQPLEREQGVSG